LKIRDLKLSCEFPLVTQKVVLTGISGRKENLYENSSDGLIVPESKNPSEQLQKTAGV